MPYARRDKARQREQPEHIILVTGDNNQLDTTCLVSNQLGYEPYVDHCINAVFPNSITLHENKRKTQADKGTLRQFREDIFNDCIPTSIIRSDSG